jgi:hypothetical protein
MRAKPGMMFLPVMAMALLIFTAVFAGAQDQVWTSGTFTQNLTASDLTVTGTADIWGNSTFFGTLVSGGATYPGLGLYYNGANPSVQLMATGTGVTWEWCWTGGSPPLSGTTMLLDQSNRLILFSPTSGLLGITLDPSGTSSFTGSVTMSGTDNEMPNQNLAGANSILTMGLADSRYVQGSTANGTLALGMNSSASGTNSTAIGYQALANETDGSAVFGSMSEASGNFATAVGYGIKADGQGSTAMGNSAYATGTDSTAIGYQSQAGGYGATAIGNQASASGSSSTALGYSSVASGNNSIAAGNYLNASGYGQLVVGQYNVQQGDPANWILTDDLFIIGNGTASGPSDALEVKKSGDMVVHGNVSVSGTGNVVLVNQAGDLSMGSFVNGPAPTQ